MKRFLALLLFVPIYVKAIAAEPDFSVLFADYGECRLELDVYMPQDTVKEHYCVIFAYGGGFKTNNQRDENVKVFCRRLADDGYVAIATDYRLGLGGVVYKGKLSMIKPLENAMKIATEDMFSAVSFTLDHAAEWGVRPDGIILCGSSAGAVTSLQADYELCNRSAFASALPEDFRFAGVASFSGAVLSHNGACKYPVHAPAPTLMLHGTEDKLVTYNHISFFNIRFSGSSDLVKQFKKNGWPHEIIRFKGQKHSVAGSYLRNYDQLVWFLDNMVKAGRHLEIDRTVNDHDYVAPEWDSKIGGPGSYYNQQ